MMIEILTSFVLLVNVGVATVSYFLPTVSLSTNQHWWYRDWPIDLRSWSRTLGFRLLMPKGWRLPHMLWDGLWYSFRPGTVIALVTEDGILCSPVPYLLLDMLFWPLLFKKASARHTFPCSLWLGEITVCSHLSCMFWIFQFDVSLLNSLQELGR